MMKSTLLCLFVILSLSFANIGSAQETKSGDVSGTSGERTIIWGRERDGLQAGAYVLRSSNRLQPGDPIVVQFVLQNVSDEQKTVVVQSMHNTHPVLGEDNRIEVNILGDSQQKTQHILKPDQILTRRNYRVVVSTDGLRPGKYNVTANVAFWLSDDSKPNQGSGLGHGRPIEIALGDEAKWPEPVAGDALKPTDGIHWGKPVSGIVVGMKVRNFGKPFSSDSTITGDLFAKNVSDAPIEFEYEIPGRTDWNMSVNSDGMHVNLDSVWYSGMRQRVTRAVTLAVNESVQLTGVEMDVESVELVDVSAKKQLIESPAIRILGKKTEFQYGDLPRLITTHGKYDWTAHLTITLSTVSDLTLVAGSSSVPFEIAAD